MRRRRHPKTNQPPAGVSLAMGSFGNLRGDSVCEKTQNSNMPDRRKDGHGHEKIGGGPSVGQNSVVAHKTGKC